ncbi:MAG: DNA cytosine methyltransferase [Candidatus Saccharimonadales bacterium]
MKVIDLFAGVGGLSLGFSQEGFEVVYANEYDKSIAKSFKLNHPSATVDDRDISEIDIEETFSKYRGQITVVMGGPPCQGFSQKGKRIGLRDHRNFMFQKFVKVVEVVKPEFFLLENVPNILTAEGGYFKREIIDMFSELGYDVKATVLKAEQFGVPQSRRRAVFLGRKKRLGFDIPTGTGESVTVLDAISDLPNLESGAGTEQSEYTAPASTQYQKTMRAGARKLMNHVATKHSSVALERLKYIGINGTKEDLPDHHRTKSIHSGTWTRLKPDGYARTITTRFDTPSSGQFTLPYQDRCITVREAARLQSFPDTFVFHGTKTNQMLQVGNAVPPKLARALAKEIKANL